VRVTVAAEMLATDAHGVSQLDDGPAIAAETARRLCCDASIVAVAVDPATGDPTAESAATASIPRATRRAVRRRDGDHCQFVGCESALGLHIHHIVHRARGGTHDLANLVTLCRVHHHSVHEGGYEIRRRPDLALEFSRPDGHTLAPPRPQTGSARQLCARNHADRPAPGTSPPAQPPD
jgi:hypothetical protein